MTGIGEKALAQPVKPPLRERCACLAKLVKNRLTLTEKNHVEIRKLLPKGAGARFDRLTAADCALLMSQVNSEPRGALGFLTPARVLRMALGEDASALMDAFGIEELAPGKLDLTPGCIERARAARGEGPLAG